MLQPADGAMRRGWRPSCRFLPTRFTVPRSLHDDTIDHRCSSARHRQHQSYSIFGDVSINCFCCCCWCFHVQSTTFRRRLHHAGPATVPPAALGAAWAVRWERPRPAVRKQRISSLSTRPCGACPPLVSARPPVLELPALLLPLRTDRPARRRRHPGDGRCCRGCWRVGTTSNCRCCGRTKQSDRSLSRRKGRKRQQHH